MRFGRNLFAVVAMLGVGTFGWMFSFAQERTARKPEKIQDERLHNAFLVHEKVITGAQPDEKGFQAIKELGVRTIISVDGARPDVTLAKKYGLRYVHMPHGYDGIPDERAKELAKAVRELPGPIYIHCHHGKHRSPAATATACVGAGLIAPVDSLSILEAAGTSKGYRGLYYSVEEARPFDPRLLDELQVAYQETVQVPPMAEAMVAMEHTHDHLKFIADAGWKVPSDHPDLVPAHEALLMREHYTEMLRTDEVQAKPADFLKWMKLGEDGSRELRQSLQKWHASGAKGSVPGSVTAAFEKINQSCTQCHVQFRNKPLQQKTQ